MANSIPISTKTHFIPIQTAEQKTNQLENFAKRNGIASNDFNNYVRRYDRSLGKEPTQTIYGEEHIGANLSKHMQQILKNRGSSSNYNRPLKRVRVSTNHTGHAIQPPQRPPISAAAAAESKPFMLLPPNALQSESREQIQCLLKYFNFNLEKFEKFIRKHDGLKPGISGEEYLANNLKKAIRLLEKLSTPK